MQDISVGAVFFGMLFLLVMVGIFAKAMKAKTDRERHEELINTIKNPKDK